MKKKSLSIVFLGIFLLIPFIGICNAQGTYVGIKSGDKYEWALSVYAENWNTYKTDDLEVTLENLMPLGSSNLTKVYNDWMGLTPPQSYWPLTVNVIGLEETGQVLSPYDNRTIRSTPVDGKFSWEIPEYSDSNEWDQTWNIVNDTSSFLRQTLNLSRLFSPYEMFSVLFAPTTISWSSFVSEILTVMSSKGVLYENITVTAHSDGFLIYIPPLGFENNSAAIDIKVNYNSNGVLSYYDFSYGGQKLVDFIPGKYIPENERIPNQYLFIFIVLTAILIVEIIIYIYMQKRRE